MDWKSLFAYREISKLSEKEILGQAYRKGYEYEKTRYGCSQCVVAALEEVLQLNCPELVKASFPLAGGVVNSTEGTCGALSGGLLIIGFLFGRNQEEFLKNKFNRKSIEVGDTLYQMFKEEYGSILCKDIQKKIFGRSYNLKNFKEKEAFENAGGHDNKCPSVVGRSCSWTTKIILEQI